MAYQTKKEKLVASLFEGSDMELIGGVADLIMVHRFDLKDCLRHLGKKKLKLISGFTLTPHSSRLKNITVTHLPDSYYTVNSITFGGDLKYRLDTLLEKFGQCHMAYNPRDDYSGFFFRNLPREIHAAELEFVHYDVIADSKKNAIFARSNLTNSDKPLNEISPADVTFQHFTLRF